ncbi:MAG: hypothetical protein ACFE0Q_18260 [Anaerolineae bacterium]
MAKRNRKKNKPNLPDSVLARARRNAGVAEPEPQVDEGNQAVDDASTEDNPETKTVTERAARRRKLDTVQLERSRKRGELTNELIEEVLHNPTKIVTEEELREDYKHVIADLRNIGLLAALLITMMFSATYFLPFI